MLISAIADTHCQLNKVNIPGADILIHAGDLTYTGKFIEIQKEIKGLAKMKGWFKEVILIAGNHDWLGEKDPHLMKQLCEDHGLIYLNDSGVTIDGWNIWGSPISPYFLGWAFNRYRGEEIKRHWDMIPDDTEILITHAPPANILDKTPTGVHAGCEDLRARVKQLKRLKTHIFGHIHHGYGTKTVKGVCYLNVSICTEKYAPVNKPLQVLLEKS